MNSKNPIKMVAIFLVSIFIGFTILIFILNLITQTQTFKNWLKDNLIREVSQRTGLSLNLGPIEGNFFNELTIQKIRLKEPVDEIKERKTLSIDIVKLKISPLSLLFGSLTFSKVNLSGLKLIGVTPYEFKIDNIFGYISFRSNILIMNNLTISTSQSQLKLKGKIKLEDDTFVDLQIQFPQISLLEIEKISPLKKTLTLPPFSLFNTLAGEAKIKGKQSDLALSLLIYSDLGNRRIQCQAKGNLDLSDLTYPRYNLKTRFKNLPLIMLLNKQNFQNSLPSYLDLYAKIEGMGLQAEEASANFEIIISPFSLFGQPIESTKIVGRWNKKNLHLIKLSLHWMDSFMELKGEVGFYAPFFYQLNFSFWQLNLKDLGYIEQIRHKYKELPASRLNGKIQLSGMIGKKFTEDLQAEGSIKLFSSSLGEKFLDDFYLAGDFRANRLRLREGKLCLEGLNFSMQGSILRERMDLTWNLEELNLAKLGAEFKSWPVEGLVTGYGKVTGDLNDPCLEGQVNSSNIKYKNYSLSNIEIKGTGKGLSFDDLNFKLNINADSLTLPNKKQIDDLHFKANKSESQLTLDIKGKVSSQLLQARGLLEISPSQGMKVQIARLSFPLDQIIWENKGNILLYVDSNSLEVHSFEIKSPHGYLSITGQIKWAGEQKIKIIFYGLPMSQLNKWTWKNNPLKGTVAGEVSLMGTLKSPEMEGKVTIKKIIFNKLLFENYIFYFTYQKKNLISTSSLFQGKKEVLHLSGQIPVDLSFGAVEDRLGSSGLVLTIQLNELDLGFLPEILPFLSRMRGALSGNGEIKGSISDPQFEGLIGFQNTSFQINRILQDFKIKKARIYGNNRQINIEQVTLEGESGVGEFSGIIKLSEKFLTSLTCKLKMKQWLIIYSTQSSFTLNGELAAQGVLPEISLAGKILIPKAKVNLADFIFSKQDYPDIKVVKEKGSDKTKLVEKSPSFFTRNLALTLEVKIPRNAWIKGDQIDAELMGDLIMKKTYYQPLIVTGNIQSLGGIYKFHGKEFEIQKGAIQFQGLPEINPILDMKTVYRIIEDDKITNIFIIITGTKNSPIVSLQSEPGLSQNDIISYLVFGRSSENLNQRQSANLQGEAFALLGRIVATQVLGVFSEKLPVDTIQIRATEQGTGSLEIGKYLTRDVFVSFGKEFGQEGSDRLSVRYYLYSNLTLETEIRGDERSGVDLIWKKDF